MQQSTEDLVVDASMVTKSWSSSKGKRKQVLSKEAADHASNGSVPIETSSTGASTAAGQSEEEYEVEATGP